MSAVVVSRSSGLISLPQDPSGLNTISIHGLQDPPFLELLWRRCSASRNSWLGRIVRAGSPGLRQCKASLEILACMGSPLAFAADASVNHPQPQFAKLALHPYFWPHSRVHNLNFVNDLPDHARRRSLGSS